jgi:hypothetical protein
MTNRDDAALTDAWLEEEIEQALAVEPSPEFLARVRTHIAIAPKASRWSRQWPLVVASLAAVVLALAAVLMWQMTRSRLVVPPDVPAVVRATEPRVAPQSAPPVTPGVEPRRHPAAQLKVRHEPRQTVAPEVLSPEGEATALRRLMRGLHAGRVAEGARASAVAQPMTDILLKPLAPLTPVEVEPLESLTRQEGVRQ